MPRPAKTLEQRRQSAANFVPIMRELKRQERAQAWLARKLGVHSSTITYWKQGQRQPPEKLLAQAREILNLPPLPPARRLTKARDSPHHAA